ncbi:hypothetical protein [Wukongibacter sp. M2B1]|uniref:hypothetical protein n=1 Tax=Wukongibacter sp. M2B1 TaxID=3088895 RepID=UPI003D7A5BCA
MSKSDFKYLIFILCLVMLVPVTLFSWNYSIYSKGIIEDRNLYRYLKDQYSISGSIQREDFGTIHRLNIGHISRTRNSDGVQYFKGIKDFIIIVEEEIYGYSVIDELEKFKEITICKLKVKYARGVFKLKNIRLYFLILRSFSRT